MVANGRFSHKTEISWTDVIDGNFPETPQRRAYREAAELPTKLAPTKKTRGRFLSRLLYEHQARLEERQHLRQVLEPVLEEALG